MFGRVSMKSNRWLFLCLGVAAATITAAAIAVAVGAGAPVQRQVIVVRAGVAPHSKVVTRSVALQAPGIAGVNSTASGPVVAPGILPPATPVPVSPTLISVNNSWLVADGSELVAVYAGSSTTNASTGRFVIVRQSFPAASQQVTVVDVAGSGALTIVSGPGVGVASQVSPTPAMLTSDIGYRDADGASGVLSLATDSTAASP
jgi:hypothetical protein